jgi:acyl-coenzyme A thioesterase PaaI-like protein
MKLNVFAAGRPGDELIATAEHLHAGRSTHVVEVRVRSGERLVANLLVTQLVLAPSD